MHTWLSKESASVALGGVARACNYFFGGLLGVLLPRPPPDGLPVVLGRSGTFPLLPFPPCPPPLGLPPPELPLPFPPELPPLLVVMFYLSSPSSVGATRGVREAPSSVFAESDVDPAAVERRE